MSEKYTSWGRYPSTPQKGSPLFWTSDAEAILTQDSLSTSEVLPYGLGRSYGDCCLNDRGVLLATPGLNHFISFDPESGVLRCEAGVRLSDILGAFLPRGWFPPVLPGTQYVTIGGAIANDIHGKNHHVAGTFGCFVQKMGILRSKDGYVECSPEDQADLFAATIGGLGLTGLILWAEIQLKPVKGPFIESESIRFSKLTDFFTLSAESDKEYEYSVAWIDCLAKGESLGRGIFIRGNHSSTPALSSRRIRQDPLISIPIEAPPWLLNRHSIKAFNWLYYHKQLSERIKKRVSFVPFFFPLDILGHWNKLYGKDGFLQYQFVVPRSQAVEVITELLTRTEKAGQGSFLSVLKIFGAIPSPGLLSFPMEGVTLTLDFAFRGQETLQTLTAFDTVVRQAGGRVYPAKDARMSSESFKSFFPMYKEFQQAIDPKFSSSFWRRVMGES